MPHQETWETYASAWKITDPAERRRVLTTAVTDDCVYADPLTKAEGRDALMAYMDTFQQQFPGGGFVAESFADHHEQSIAHWRMVDGEGNPAGTGTSFGRYDADGRLLSMTGSFPVQG